MEEGKSVNLSTCFVNGRAPIGQWMDLQRWIKWGRLNVPIQRRKRRGRTYVVISLTHLLYIEENAPIEKLDIVERLVSVQLQFIEVRWKKCFSFLLSCRNLYLYHPFTSSHCAVSGSCRDTSGEQSFSSSTSTSTLTQRPPAHRASGSHPAAASPLCLPFPSPMQGRITFTFLYHSQGCFSVSSDLIFYLHSNHHPTCQALCPLTLSIINLLLPLCLLSIPFHLTIHLDQLLPPLLYLLPICLLLLLILSPMPHCPILLIQFLVPFSPALLPQCLFALCPPPLTPLRVGSLHLLLVLLWSQWTPPSLSCISPSTRWSCQTCMRLSSLSSRPCGTGVAHSVSTMSV